MIKVAVIGASGYMGAEAVRLLHGHPAVELAGVTAHSQAGKPFWEVYPHLYGLVDLVFDELRISQLVAAADFVLVALPHGHAAPVAREVLRQGKRVIDLGADFRFRDARVYEAWYKTEHTAGELCSGAVYGQPELNRAGVAGARLVGNPGCYPTASLLGLAPLLKDGLVDTGSIVIDAKSGASGAGRGLSQGLHFAEVNENFRAYSVGVHRHTPEIEQELGVLAGHPVTVSFTPHLVPMSRGILATIYAVLTADISQQEAEEVFGRFYAGERFVRVLPPGHLPQTKAVMGSNFCDLAVRVDHRTKRIVVLSVIDNLVKGGSGQAVQNLNIMAGLPEDTALGYVPLFP